MACVSLWHVDLFITLVTAKLSVCMFVDTSIIYLEACVTLQHFSKYGDSSNFLFIVPACII
jgi:hypothetical protein